MPLALGLASAAAQDLARDETAQTLQKLIRAEKTMHKRMHGDDERVPAASLPVGTDFLHRVILEMGR